jgi:hypothetical protein
MQVLEAADDHLKLQIGTVKPTAWANSCATSFDEIKALAGKNVMAQYTEKENKKFPNSPYKNVIKVVANADVAPAPNTPVSPNAETNWQEVAYREECGKCINSFIARDHFKTPEEAMQKYVQLVQHELSPATKSQEALFANPPMSTKAKPAVMPSVQGAKTSRELWGEINDFVSTYKWGTNKLKQEAMRLAKEENWDNGELIAENGIKAMDIGQLTHFVAFLKTEIAKSAK